MLNIRLFFAFLVAFAVTSTVILAAPNRILMRFGKRALGGIPAVHLGGEYVPLDYFRYTYFKDLFSVPNFSSPYGPDNDF